LYGGTLNWAEPPDLDHLDVKHQEFQPEPEARPDWWETNPTTGAREAWRSSEFERLPSQVEPFCRDCGWLEPVTREQVLDARRASRTRKIKLTLRKHSASHSVE
jgi:hypothetical protein